MPPQAACRACSIRQQAKPGNTINGLAVFHAKSISVVC